MNLRNDKDECQSQSLLSASIKSEIRYQYIGFIASLRMLATPRRKRTKNGYLPRTVCLLYHFGTFSLLCLQFPSVSFSFLQFLLCLQFSIETVKRYDVMSSP